MSASVSPSLGSGIFLNQSRQSAASSNMRLPPVNELFRMTDRASEHNRIYGHHNSTPTQMTRSKPPGDFIDLTSASPHETLSSPNPREPSSTNSRFPIRSGDPRYIDVDLISMTNRLSRNPSDHRSHPPKRRRRNDSNDFLMSVARPPHTTLTIPSSPPIETKKEPEVQMRNSSKKESEIQMRSGSKDDESTPGSSQQKAIPVSQSRVESLDEPEEEEEQLDPKDQQDRQLADTIKAQTGISNSASKLNQLTCIICMDNMTNMTATSCGHVFCHTCIMEALIAGENRSDGRPAPKCPMCRTRIRRKVLKGQPEVIPLNLKLTTRKGKTKGKNQ